MADDEPKSAFELAMERLSKQDAEQGRLEQPLTEQQKKAIEEARRACQAKIAQLEIMHRSRLTGVDDAEAQATLERAYRRDVERATDERDRTIAKIRRGD